MSNDKPASTSYPQKGAYGYMGMPYESLLVTVVLCMLGTYCISHNRTATLAVTAVVVLIDLFLACRYRRNDCNTFREFFWTFVSGDTPEKCLRFDIAVKTLALAITASSILLGTAFS